MRDIGVNIRALTENFCRETTVREWLSKKAESEDLVSLREHMTTMPTLSGIDMRFK